VRVMHQMAHVYCCPWCAAQRLIAYFLNVLFRTSTSSWDSWLMPPLSRSLCRRKVPEIEGSFWCTCRESVGIALAARRWSPWVPAGGREQGCDMCPESLSQ
jgi:hypothetical protein